MAHTTVVVPTFKRPDMLARCLRSCFDFTLPRGLGVDVVVVDNSPEAEARAQVRALAAEAGGLKIRYAHEAVPGISAARNRGLSMCEGEYVAFLDDDEEATPDWIAQLHEARERHQADVVFGRVEVQIPQGGEWAADMLQASFGRRFELAEGVVPTRFESRLGTGNSLFSSRWLSGASTFAEHLGLVGGEDTMLIAGLIQRGARLVWAPAAVVAEYVLPERVCLQYLAERRFGSGQWSTRRQLRGPLGLGKAGGWMLLGAGQAALGSGRAALSALSGSDSRAHLCDAAAGLGKVLWFSPFQLARYRRPSKEKSA